MLWRCHDFFETILSFFYRRHSTPFAVLRRSSNSFLIHSDLIRHVSSRRFFYSFRICIYMDPNKYLFVSFRKWNISKNWIAHKIWKITIIINFIPLWYFILLIFYNNTKRNNHKISLSYIYFSNYLFFQTI